MEKYNKLVVDVVTPMYPVNTYKLVNEFETYSGFKTVDEDGNPVVVFSLNGTPMQVCKEAAMDVYNEYSLHYMVKAIRARTISHKIYFKDKNGNEYPYNFFEQMTDRQVYEFLNKEDVIRSKRLILLVDFDRYQDQYFAFAYRGDSYKYRPLIKAIKSKNGFIEEMIRKLEKACPFSPIHIYVYGKVSHFDVEEMRNTADGSFLDISVYNHRATWMFRKITEDTEYYHRFKQNAMAEKMLTK